MARSTLSLGILLEYALSIARRRRGLPSGSPPPSRAATVISLINRVKFLPRLASCLPLRCWMFAHLLCPAILFPEKTNHVVLIKQVQRWYHFHLFNPIFRPRRGKV